MKMIVEEYGLVMVAILACVFLLFLMDWMPRVYRDWSTRFIQSITGVSASWSQYYNDSDVSASELLKKLESE